MAELEELRQRIAAFEEIEAERKQAEETLRESEARFRNAFDHAALGMVLVSPNGYFLKVNSYFCLILGYMEGELLTKTFNDVTHPDDHRIGLEVLRQVVDGTIPFGWTEKRYLQKDGRVVWGMLSTSVVRDAAGKASYLVSHIQDITDRMLAKREENSLKPNSSMLIKWRS